MRIKRNYSFCQPKSLQKFMVNEKKKIFLVKITLDFTIWIWKRLLTLLLIANCNVFKGQVRSNLKEHVKALYSSV